MAFMLVHKEKAFQTKERLLVLQLHHTLHRAVVVEQVDGADHLDTLGVRDTELEASDCVAPSKFHKLSCWGEFGVHTNGRQLENLRREADST